MADWPSGFVLLAVVPLMALVFCGCTVWSATLLLKIRIGGAKFALPFLICALTLAILATRRCTRSRCSRISAGTGKTANGSWRRSKPAS